LTRHAVPALWETGTPLGRFSAAMENDRRLREMVSMRAAAEADARTLLARLGRKEITDSVVGAESGLLAVIKRVQLVAWSDVPVLVLGGTGTGKELIARLIHTQSSRSSGPFLRINCGAIPLERIDAQYLGPGARHATTCRNHHDCDERRYTEGLHDPFPPCASCEITKQD
jgi:transcriptional regulator with AAA-type ATPase domain